jgi:hypothetical protein
MANYTADAIIDTVGGPGPFCFALPVDAGSKVFAGSLCTQLTATGMVVPYSTAAAGVAVGVAQHAADNSAAGTADGDKRVRIETKRMFAFDNGAGADAFSEASLIGSLVYGTDDHTVADNSSTQTRKAVGFFYGMESDGKVRVYVDPALATIVNILQLLTDAPATADALRETIVAAFG